MKTLTSKQIALNESYICLQRAESKLNRMREIGWFLLAKTNESKKQSINEQFQIIESYKHLINILSK
jgi:hypothetical protein